MASGHISVNKKRRRIDDILLWTSPAVVFACAAALALRRDLLPALALIPLIFLCVKLNPVFRRRETLGVFFTSVPGLVPVNIRLVFYIMTLYESSNMPQRIMLSMLFFLILMSVEENFLCFVSRLFWPRQKKLF